jgi:AcrR family transcriptional regulator
MVSKDDQRERAISRLSAYLLATGLSQTSLRQLAAAAGVSDRMILYYFTDKADIIQSVLARIAAEMTALLDGAVPQDAQLSASALMTRAAQITLGPKMRPYMALWIEIIAAAAKAEQPYLGVSKLVTAGFLDWIETRLAGAPSPEKRGAAAMVFAMIDGLTILDMCAGPDASAMAVQAMTQGSAVKILVPNPAQSH